MRIPRYVVKNLSRFQNFRTLSIAKCPVISSSSSNPRSCTYYHVCPYESIHALSLPVSTYSYREFHVCRSVVFSSAKAETNTEPSPERQDPDKNNQNSSNNNNNSNLDKESQHQHQNQQSKDGNETFPHESEHDYEQRRINEAYEDDKKKEQSKQREYTAEERKRDYRKKYTVNSAVITRDFFENTKKKNKEAFLSSIEAFTTRDKFLRGHVEFIYAALKHMKEFGIHRDLESYKKLIDVFPKGKMVAQSFWQVEFMHYPKQQFCAIDILEQMEDNGVMGDSEIEDMLENIFGSKSFPSRKHCRMMYWMPKFKNLSPWYLPDPLPDDCLELVKLAIQRITSVDLQTKITIFNAEDLEDSVDHTWIVSGQSPDQQALIESHPADRPIYVEGAFRVWLRDQCINYFILRSAPRPPPKEETKIDPDDVGILHHVFTEDYVKNAVIPLPTVHEQEDGIILACCATATSSRDSVVSWIRFLQESNPRLGKDISVLFTLKSPIGPTDNLDDPSLSGEEAAREALREKEKDSGLIGMGLGFDPVRPELDQVGIERLSDTKFRNWPHHFNRKTQVYEEDTERIDDLSQRWKNKITELKSNIDSDGDSNTKKSS